MTPQRDSQVKVSVLLRAGHNVSEVANLVRVSRKTVYTQSRRAWTMAKVSTDVQTVVETLLFWGTACGMPCEGQQSLDHCLHVCWQLRYRLCAFTRLSLCGTILKYTTIINLFIQCHSYRESDELNKSRIDTNCQTTRIVSKDFDQFFRPARYMTHLKIWSLLRGYFFEKMNLNIWHVIYIF